MHIQVRFPLFALTVWFASCFAVASSPYSVSPAPLPVGMTPFCVYGPGISAASSVIVGSRVATVTSGSSGSICANGYVDPWATGRIVIKVVTGDTSLDIPTALQRYETSYEDAARYSAMAGFGPREDVIESIMSMGYPQWIAAQLQLPASTWPTDNMTWAPMYAHMLAGQNLLRQKVAYVLEHFIVDNSTLPGDWSRLVYFHLILENDAFANYRQVLSDITLAPQMGTYLNMVDNDATGNGYHPNQNYAREVMQLFAIGQSELNADGTTQLDSLGQPKPSYDQNTVLSLSRALTGWTYAKTAGEVLWNAPMVAVESKHDHGEKVLFGDVELAAGNTAPEDLQGALDAVFAQPSVAPYISKLLIQGLVSGDPSSAYIQRVSSVFNDDGSGVRGNLGAVVTAILLDPEAISYDPAAGHGHLKDADMFMLSSLTLIGAYIQDDYGLLLPLGGFAWQPYNVFGFYDPTYTIPGTNTTAPEYQIYDTAHVALRTSMLFNILMQQEGSGVWANPPESWLISHYPTPPQLAVALNHIIFHGELADEQVDELATLAVRQAGQDAPVLLQDRWLLFLALASPSAAIIQ